MQRPEDILRLKREAAARPGDPVVWARFTVALHGLENAHDEGVLVGPLSPDEPDELMTSLDAIRHTDELVRNCLAFGLVGPATDAAELLHTAIGSEGTAILLAEVTLRRNQAGDIARARALLEATVASRPDAREARLRAAALALGTGDLEAARRWIEPVAADSAGTRALYAQVLLASGEVEAAAHEALLGLEGEPESVDLHLLRGVAELAQAHNEDAIESFSEALRLAPERSEAYYNLGLAFVATGSRAAALGVVEAGLELAPDDERLIALMTRLKASFSTT
jgi:tetratricopeptide (TPR) repeat protein